MKELILKVKSGCKDSEELLFIQNKGLIMNAMKLFGYQTNDEDVFSIGSYGLLMAIRTFDLKREIEFSSYATKCIMNEFRKDIKKNKALPLSNALSLNDETDKGTTYVDFVPCNYTNKGFVMSDYKDLNIVLSELSFIDKKIFEMKFFEMYKNCEIIETLGLNIDRGDFSRYLKNLRQKVANGLLSK